MAVHPGRNVTQAAISAAAGSNSDLVTATAGQYIYVLFLVVTLTAAGTIKFTEGTGPTDITGDMTVVQGSGFVIKGDADYPVLWTPTIGVKLGITPTTGNARGWLAYFKSSEKP